MRVKRESRAEDDGYRSGARCPGCAPPPTPSGWPRRSPSPRAPAQPLRARSPGALRARSRARRRRTSSGRPGCCFLIAYLCPLEGEDPFVGSACGAAPECSSARAAGDLGGSPLGPRTSHDPARGAGTLDGLPPLGRARRPVASSSGVRGRSRVEPRAALRAGVRAPRAAGLRRMGRYELLVTLGRLGLYELRADSLPLTGAQRRALRRPHDARRQARLRHRRSAAPRAPRGDARRGGRGADRSPRPGARQLERRRSAATLGFAPRAQRTAALERLRARAWAGAALPAQGALEPIHRSRLTSTRCLHNGAYSRSQSYPTRESRCHSASSSRRTRSA